MARGFPVLADNHLQQAVVEGLLAQGWDVQRAIDIFPEGTDDEVLLIGPRLALFGRDSPMREGQNQANSSSHST